MWWIYAIAIVVAVVGYALLVSPPKSPIQEPGTLEGTTAEEGIAIPVAFGTVKISTANIVWSGDISTKPIKSSGGKK